MGLFKNHIIKAGLIFFMINLLFQISTFAQFDIDDEGPIPDSLLNQLPLAAPEPDTLVISSFTFSNILANTPYRDSILHNLLAQYNPLFESNQPYISLGNLGSAAIPMHQILPSMTGLDFGFHEFDVYRMETDSFKWNRVNIPFADLYFAAGRDSPEFRVKSKFSKNFPGGWNMNLDYQRIMEDGYYQNQATKQSSLTVGFWHLSKNKRSNSFFTFLNNINQEENNGGITNDSLFAFSIYDIRSGMPVNLSSSLSRQQQNKFEIRNFYSLLPQNDSIQLTKKFELAFSSLGSYERGFYRFYDHDTDNLKDSLFYGGLLVDDIGLRRYISYEKYSVSPGIRANYNKGSQLDIGINYDLWRINYEPLEVDLVHDIKLYGKFDLIPFKNARVRFNSAFHLGDYTGDLLLKGEISYQLKKYIKLFGSQELKRAHPAIIQNELWVSGKQVYKNDFSISTHSSTTAGIGIPALGFYASANFESIGNYIFYDRELFFTQSDVQVNLIRFQLDQNFTFKGFHWDNSFHLFQTDAEFLDLPLYHLISKLYYHNPILQNKLLLDTGFEFYFTENTFVPSYQAVTASFYYQDDFKSQLAPILNYYASFKVGDFRVYARTENILSLINGRIQYQAKYYPQNDFKAFRIGVRWQFLN